MEYPDAAAALPESLRKRAIVLAGEYAWYPADVEDVIAAFQALGVAVLGLELWMPEGDSPRFLAATDYEVPAKRPWSKYVSENARLALDEFRRRSIPRGAVVNMTCLSEWAGGIVRRAERRGE
jgi:hypothetical protein